MAVFRDFCRIVSGAVFALCVVFISNSSFAADYSIAYVLDDGVAGESQPTTAATGTSFNVSNPTKSGYTFAGWKITGMDTSSHTIGNTTTTNQTANLVTDTTFNNLRQTSGTVTFTAQWCQSCSATNGATCELQISENAETGELQCRYVTECQEEPTNLGYVIARADAYNPYCRIRCSAGTVVTGRYGTCTTPTTDFGWYKAAHWVTYGRISQYNYCMPGYNNTGTTSGYHDAKSDCKATIPAGHTVSSTTMPVRYVRATSNGSDKNTYTHMVEIQAFEANDGTGTNLLAGKGSTTSLKKATDGSWTRSNYASGASLVWDMGSVQNVGSIKFAMYTDGRTYHDVKISVSTDNTNWTDVLGPIELPTDYSSTPTGELIVLTGLPQSCSAGTYKAAQTISLNNSTGSCTACATGSYSAAGSGTCAPCPAGTYYDSNSCYSCSEETSGDFPYADIGASSIYQCYTTGTVNCATFNPYFGNGTPVYRNQTAPYKQYYDIDYEQPFILNDDTACDILSLSCDPGYTESSVGTYMQNIASKFVSAHTCALSGNSGACQDEDYNMGPGSIIGTFSESAEFQVVKGRLACTDVPGDDSSYTSRIRTDVSFNPALTTGAYCWGQATEIDDTPINASWFYWRQYNSIEECRNRCGFVSSGAERYALLNTFALTLENKMCIPEYTITYNLNGGTNYANAPTTYNSTTATITLGTPTKSGYEFGGWYDNSGLTGDAITQIENGSTGNKTLWAKWNNNAFTITTTSTDSFSFNMSASGNFVVDCGDAGILSGDGVFGNAITRSSTTEATYTCEYPTAATHTITFTGTATGYSTANSTAAIRFNINNRTNDTNAPKISSISGSLGAIFSTLNNGSNDLSKQPRFYNTFYGSSRLTSLPSGLFSGISGAANYMFYSTFRGCSGLTSLPSGLFNGISGAANYMFGGTFYNCTGLTSLPSGLFNGISGAADYMFSNTFRGCTGLTSLPSGLFNGISGAANYMFQATFGGCTSLTSLPSGLFNGISGAADSMFQATFLDCTSLTSLPAGLFNGISGAADNMFESTFDGCSGLTSLPSDLFNGISGAATDMFSGTFYDCTGLTSLPSGLFNGISGAADSMFTQTFQNCSSLASLPSGLFNGISGSAQAMFNYTFSGCGGLTSVPYNLFAGASGTPGNYMFQRTFYNDSQLNTFILADGTSTVNYIPAEFFGSISGGTNVMPDIFYNNTAIASSCPNGTVQNITGYESQWNGRVSCLPANTVTLYRNYDSNDNTTLATITVVNGNAMPSIDASGTALTAPTRDGYTFTGYYSARTNGTQYYNTDMTSAANWTSDSDGNLYAQWGPNYITCSAGEYLTSNETCTICPVGYWCPATSVQYVPNGDDQGKTACAAGTYQNQTGQSSCITSESGYYVNTVAATSQTQCPIGTYSPAGSKKASQCGHILHIGDNENDVIYLHGDKDTNPSLNVSWGGQTWYANMVQQQTKATAGSDRYFNIEYDNQLFYVCDDTMCEVNSN